MRDAKKPEGGSGASMPSALKVFSYCDQESFMSALQAFPGIAMVRGEHADEEAK
ncbi:hypothetical protein RSO41_16475 [Halomonas sp. I1]|uniref:hypothetical protein n=1 Tax=Halomonas sp. I1 TaxID=393536 RepID=UPI0028DF4C08|nr:hypothetical protein [Halomonas sp. I1]MDT8896247.1 hypothetical protein [Halomonas sp. I1]